MPPPAVATRPTWTWMVLLLGAALAAFGVSALAYLGNDDSGSMLPLRLMMALMMPVVTVGVGFAAGQMRQALSRTSPAPKCR